MSVVSATPINTRQFHDFVVKGNIEKVRDALKANEDLVFNRNGGGSTALHLAVFHCEYDIARLLLAKGADIEAENNCGRTPMSYDKAQARINLVGDRDEKWYKEQTAHQQALRDEVARRREELMQGGGW